MMGKDAIEPVHKGGIQYFSAQNNFFTMSYFSSWNGVAYLLCSAGVIMNVFMIHIY